MSLTTRHLLLVLGTLAALAAEDAAVAQVPDRIDSPDGDSPPLWVSATHAVEGIGGPLRPDLFDPEVLQDLERFLQADDSYKGQPHSIAELEKALVERPCEAATVDHGEAEPLLDGTRPPGPLKQAVGEADLIIWGTVEDYSSGFLGGRRLTSLYEVDVKEWLKIPNGDKPTASVFVTYGVAKALIYGRVWCAEGARGSLQPKPDGEVLIVAKTYAVLRSDPTVIEGAAALFFETADNQVSGPVGTADAPAEWNALVVRVREVER